jgi:hypothetical protein
MGDEFDAITDARSMLPVASGYGPELGLKKLQAHSTLKWISFHRRMNWAATHGAAALEDAVAAAWIYPAGSCAVHLQLLAAVVLPSAVASTD